MDLEAPNEGTCLGLVLGVLLGAGPGGGSELETLPVLELRLLGLELGELFLHVLVVSRGLALLGTSSTGLLGRHDEYRVIKEEKGRLRFEGLFNEGTRKSK